MVPSFISFHLLLLQRANLDFFEFFFPGIIFDLNLENICSYYLRGKKLLVLVDDGKRKSKLGICNTFEKMEGSKDTVESLKSY
jgi:hypothetical protein